MMDIVEGLIIAPTSTGMSLREPHRILQLLPKLDRVIMIPVHHGPRKNGKKPSNYYARGFHVESLSAVREWAESGLLESRSPPSLPAWWSWSDEQLIKECPTEKLPTHG